MSALKSIGAIKSQVKSYSLLKALCSQVKLSQTYTTEPPSDPPPEISEVSSLPGRKHVYEPDYLDLFKPEFPPYPVLNIKMKGYDFVVLERLQKLIYGYLNSLNIDVLNGYALRAESWKISRFTKNTSTAEAEFQLKEYQRVLKLSDVPSIKMGIILEIIQAVTPPGVTCTIAKHTEQDDKIRFIPDFETKALQEQLDELGGPSKLALQREKEAQRKK